MQKKQAAGIDTRMMVPVYAGIFAVLCHWFLPWISLPVLKSVKLPTAYTIPRFSECLKNLQTCILTGDKLQMAPLTKQQLSLFQGIGTTLVVLCGVMTVLMILCCILVFMKKSASRPFVKVTFFCQLLLSGGLAVLGLTANILLNRALGRPDSFINLSLHSYLQLTSWVYSQLLISLGVFLGAERLLDVSQEPGPQKYVERTMKEDKGLSRRTKLTLVLIVAAIPLVIFFGIFFLNDRSNVFIGLCIICLAMVPFGMVFEDRKPQARELLLIAVISAIAVVGRSAFFMIPQFKPVTAIVIIAGIGLGAEAGFLTGAVSGFVSNFFFGQGPWTPWQMFAYGIIGFLSGLLFSRRIKIHTKRGERIYMGILCAYGAAVTFFIYGLIMDLSSVFSLLKDFSWEALTVKLASGIPFNLIHATSTVVFLLFLARPMQKKLDRIKKKYGIMEV